MYANSVHSSSSSMAGMTRNSSSTTLLSTKERRIWERAQYPLHIAVVGPGAVGKYSAVSQLFYNYFPLEFNPTVERCLEGKFSLGKRTCIRGKRINKAKLNMQVTVCAGQDEYAVFRNQWIDDNEAIVIMYDVTDRDSFDDLLAWREVILERMGIEMDVSLKEMQRRDGRPKDQPRSDGKKYLKKSLILMGNKVDLVQKGIRRRQVTYTEGKRFAQKFFDFTQPALAYEDEVEGGGYEEDLHDMGEDNEDDALGIPFLECSVKDDPLAIKQAFQTVIIRAMNYREHNEAVVAALRDVKKHERIQSMLIGARKPN